MVDFHLLLVLFLLFFVHQSIQAPKFFRDCSKHACLNVRACIDNPGRDEERFFEIFAGGKRPSCFDFLTLQFNKPNKGNSWTVYVFKNGSNSAFQLATPKTINFKISFGDSLSVKSTGVRVQIRVDQSRSDMHEITYDNKKDAGQWSENVDMNSLNSIDWKTSVRMLLTPPHDYRWCTVDINEDADGLCEAEARVNGDGLRKFKNQLVVKATCSVEDVRDMCLNSDATCDKLKPKDGELKCSKKIWFTKDNQWSSVDSIKCGKNGAWELRKGDVFHQNVDGKPELICSTSAPGNRGKDETDIPSQAILVGKSCSLALIEEYCKEEEGCEKLELTGGALICHKILWLKSDTFWTAIDSGICSSIGSFVFSRNGRSLESSKYGDRPTLRCSNTRPPCASGLDLPLWLLLGYTSVMCIVIIFLYFTLYRSLDVHFVPRRDGLPSSFSEEDFNDANGDHVMENLPSAQEEKSKKEEKLSEKPANGDAEKDAPDDQYENLII